MKKSDLRRGFTLIELLVVVAIIGLLASIVIASLNTARMKGRDARRVADIKQLGLALEMFNDANSGYPSSTRPTVTAATNPLTSGGYIAAIPYDPQTVTQPYAFVPTGTLTSGTCSGYHMGAVIEQTGSASLNSAAKVAPVAICGTTANGRWGNSTSDQTTDFGVSTNGSVGCNTTAGTNTCYDVKN